MVFASLEVTNGYNIILWVTLTFFNYLFVCAQNPKESQPKWFLLLALINHPMCFEYYLKEKKKNLYKLCLFALLRDVEIIFATLKMSRFKNYLFTFFNMRCLLNCSLTQFSDEPVTLAATQCI